MNWIRTSPVLLAIAAAGGIAGWFVSGRVDPVTVRWLGSFFTLIFAIGHAQATNWQKKLDDLHNFSWPDSDVREKIRRRASQERVVVSARLYFLYGATILSFISLFGAAMTPINPWNTRCTEFAGACLFLVVYLSLRMIQGARRAAREFNNLVEKKDALDRVNDFRNSTGAARRIVPAA